MDMNAFKRLADWEKAHLQGIGRPARVAEGHTAQPAYGDGRQDLQKVALPLPNVQRAGGDGCRDRGCVRGRDTDMWGEIG